MRATKYLIPLCGALALIAACSDRDKDTGVGGDTATPPSDTAPGTTSTPATPTDVPPPSDTAPAETPPPPADSTQPSNPPPSGGG